MWATTPAQTLPTSSNTACCLRQLHGKCEGHPDKTAAAAADMAGAHPSPAFAQCRRPRTWRRFLVSHRRRRRKKLVELVQGPAHLMDVVDVPATNVNISEEQAGLRVCMPLLLGFVVAPARARMRGYAHERESCRKRALRGGAE